MNSCKRLFWQQDRKRYIKRRVCPYLSWVGIYGADKGMAEEERRGQQGLLSKIVEKWLKMSNLGN